MNRWTVLLTAMLLCTFVVMGCSSDGGSPVTPDTGPGLTSGVNEHGAQAQTHLWGYWNCYIDIETQTVEVVPCRTTLFAANVVGFLNSNNSLSFFINDTPITPDYTDVDIDITLSHPLPGLPSYDGYDVRGIFIGDGSQYMQYNSDLSYGVHGTDQTMFADPDGGNGAPDGYSRWFNAMEFTGAPPLGFVDGLIASVGYTGNCTLNPYRYFADGLGSNDDLWTWLLDNPDANGLFASGMSNTRNYYIRFPTATGINYDYAVVANWKGEDLVMDHPAPAPEMVGCSVETPVPPQVYYESPTKNGGFLVADISLFGWEYQPSTIYVESTVLSSYYTFTTEMTPVAGDDTYSTYHCEIPADDVTGLDDQEFWVIAENEGFDYTNEFGITNFADTDYLAAFFRYDLEINPEAPCPLVQPTAIDPAQGGTGSSVEDATITVGTPDLENGPNLAASLTKAGETDILGTDVSWISSTELTADFDLSGAALGFWNVEVVNGCDPAPPAGVGVDLFEVIQAGPYLRVCGDLPGPIGTNWTHDFSVQGSSAFGHPGVFYHYSTNPTVMFQVYHYAMDDYATTATLHSNLTGNYGYTIQGMLINDDDLRAIEVMAQGSMYMDSWNSGPMSWGNYPCNGPIFWFPVSGVMDNAWLYFYMQFHDMEREFSTTGILWGYWGNNPAGVDGATAVMSPPYGSGNFTSYTGYYPADHTGSQDGMVSDNEAFWHAVDSDPQGLTPPFNRIFYYLEGPPDAYGIEVMQNVSNMAFPVSLTTIDTPYEGTGVIPLDVTVVNSYGNTSSATVNWLCVLEDNGDTTWSFAVFEQDGSLVARLGPYDGDGWHCDADVENTEVHVWYDDAGTPGWCIFGFI